MRFNIPLCLSFLGALVSFSSVSARATYGHQLQLAERDAELISMRDQGLLDLRDDGFLDIRDEDLDMRDESFLDIRDVEALYEMLVRRAPKKTAAQAATRKAAASAAANKNGKAPTPKGQPKTAKHIATQKAADARKGAKKHVDGLPGRKQAFQVPNGGPKISGKAVRKAVLNSHIEQQANKGKSKTQLRNSGSPLKNFGNYDNRVPHNPNDKKPIKNMNGPGHEYPIGNTVTKGPARVITQQQNGRTKFMGVVAHDVTP